jgi:predicted dehydrogenase
MTLKVGIISAAWGAFAHLPAWRSLDGVEVTAICTSRRETAEAAAQKFGVARPFWDAQAMCADPDLDIIDIGTRPSYRHDMVLAALRNGKHIYSGIPMAHNLAAARDMHDAWRAVGTVAVVDAFSQWIPALRRAKELVDEGFTGRLMSGSCRFNMSLFNRPHPQFPYNWFWEAGLGVSSVRNNGSHLLHYLIHLLGPIRELVADDSLLLREWVFPDGKKLQPQNNDCANILLRFENGIVLPIQICWTAVLAEGWAVDLWGSDGRILTTSPIFPTSQDCKLFAGRMSDDPALARANALAPVEIPDRLKSASGIAIDWTVPVQPAYPMALAMRSMLDAMAGRGVAAPDFEQAWQVERVQEAIRISNLERRWVQIATIA